MNRYSDKELKEFKKIITNKLEIAKSQLEYSKEQLSRNDNSSDDTARSFHPIDDATDSINKEELNLIARRQESFVRSLENALIRIENKSYGVCIRSGLLISKERLRASCVATTVISEKDV